MLLPVFDQPRGCSDGSHVCFEQGAQVCRTALVFGGFGFPLPSFLAYQGSYLGGCVCVCDRTLLLYLLLSSSHTVFLLMGFS